MFRDRLAFRGRLVLRGRLRVPFGLAVALAESEGLRNQSAYTGNRRVGSNGPIRSDHNKGGSKCVSPHPLGTTSPFGGARVRRTGLSSSPTSTVNFSRAYHRYNRPNVPD